MNELVNEKYNVIRGGPVSKSQEKESSHAESDGSQSGGLFRAVRADRSSLVNKGILGSCPLGMCRLASDKGREEEKVLRRAHCPPVVRHGAWGLSVAHPRVGAEGAEAGSQENDRLEGRPEAPGQGAPLRSHH